MIVMQLREVTSCAVHGRAIIMLEDVNAQLRLTFYADLEEAQRLAQVTGRGRCAGQPVTETLPAWVAREIDGKKIVYKPWQFFYALVQS